jgi:outer membrane protein OmpA-like peptidoglycan-associated protein
MNSAPVVVASGTTNSAGNFLATIRMPGKVCVTGGLHRLVLTAVAPDGSTVEDTTWLVLDDTCSVKAVPSKKPAGNTVTLRTLLFPYRSAQLTPSSQAVLRGLVSTLNKTRAIAITGFTQAGTSNAAKKFNKLLAARRAVAVRDYLRAHGVKRPMFVYSAEAAKPADPKRQWFNRRAVITVRY